MFQETLLPPRGEAMETALLSVVKEIPAMGYGNPDAKIKYNEDNKIPAEVLDFAVECIQSGRCMVPVTEQDDGCIDGREAVKAEFYSPSGLRIEMATDPGKHMRPKVAGGGYVTAHAMKCALDDHITNVDEEIAEVAEILTEEDIVCGTHRGDNAAGDGSDCGANDKAEPIFENGLNSFDRIQGTMIDLFSRIGMNYDEGVAREVYDGWSATLAHEGYFEGSTGATRHKTIMKHIRIVQARTGKEYPVSASKHLKGGHNEDFVVLEFIEGMTFSQAEHRQRIKDEFPDLDDAHVPQAFVVNVPRIVQLAKAMAKGRKDEEKAFNVALYAGIMYQFATAATLTDGSLRMFTVQEAT